MTEWRFKLNVGMIVNKWGDREQTRENWEICAKEIAMELRKLPPSERADIEDLIDDLELGNFDDVDWYLKELYDWADNAGMWLGT